MKTSTQAGIPTTVIPALAGITPTTVIPANAGITPTTVIPANAGIQFVGLIALNQSDAAPGFPPARE